MHVNSPRARDLLALAAAFMREHGDEPVDFTFENGDEISADGLSIAELIETELAESVSATAPVYRQFVEQQEYNSKRLGEEDNWGWTDTGRNLKAKDLDDAVRVSREFQARMPSDGRFVRAHRIVERFSTKADVVVEEFKS
jgi:hypothetical protein